MFNERKIHSPRNDESMKGTSAKWRRYRRGPARRFAASELLLKYRGETGPEAKWWQ